MSSSVGTASDAAIDKSGGGLVVGPEPSKLMARVQIPVAAFCCEQFASSKYCTEGYEAYQSRAAKRACLISVQIPVAAFCEEQT